MMDSHQILSAFIVPAPVRSSAITFWFTFDYVFMCLLIFSSFIVFEYNWVQYNVSINNWLVAGFSLNKNERRKTVITKESLM